MIQNTLSDFGSGGCLIGEMQEKSDAQLLRDYAEHANEAAFREIVNRHAGVVYSSALRQVTSPDLARDVAQSIFTDLARKASSLAGTLTENSSLLGWLHRSTRFTALNQLRDDRRRLARERQVMQHFDPASETAPDWDQVQPVLDEAMADLSDEDRDALLLRFFKNHDFRAIGSTLGVSDDAAQKRVSRALERLRTRLTSRGVTTTAVALSTALSANAAPLAPVGLAAALSTSALAGTTLATTATATITKAIAMTTLQKSVITATIAVLAGVGIYETRQAAHLRDRVETLQRQQAPLAEQVEQLQNNFATTSNKLADLQAENSRLKSNRNQMELLKLRGQVTQFRKDAEQANDPVVKRALRWKTNVERMKLLFAEHPEQQVPEMKLLSEDYFFDLARDQDLESSNGVRKAFSEIRQRAKNTYAISLQQALKKFIDENAGRLPDNVSDLKPYFKDAGDDAMLDQYKLLFTGNMSDVKGNFVLRDKQVIDPEYDSYWQIGPNAYGPDSLPLEKASLASSMELLAPMVQSFMSANGGKTPTALSQLKAFVSTPEEQAAYDKLANAGVSFGQPKQ